MGFVHIVTLVGTDFFSVDILDVVIFASLDIFVVVEVAVVVVVGFAGVFSSILGVVFVGCSDFAAVVAGVVVVMRFVVVGSDCPDFAAEVVVVVKLVVFPLVPKTAVVLVAGSMVVVVFAVSAGVLALVVPAVVVAPPDCAVSDNFVVLVVGYWFLVRAPYGV